MTKKIKMTELVLRDAHQSLSQLACVLMICCQLLMN